MAEAAVLPVENAAEETAKNPAAEEEGENAFAYLDRDHFTSEKFKIEIRNLPKYYGMPVSSKI